MKHSAMPVSTRAPCHSGAIVEHGKRYPRDEPQHQQRAKTGMVDLPRHCRTDATEAREQPLPDEPADVKRRDGSDEPTDDRVHRAAEPAPDQARRDDEQRRGKREHAADRKDGHEDRGSVPGAAKLLDEGADVVPRQLVTQRREPDRCEYGRENDDDRHLQKTTPVH